MLSICTTIKNRSLVETDSGVLHLFPKCVASIVSASGAVGALELVVADWESDDWPLAEWLNSAAGSLPIRVVKLTGSFSRGRGLNAAAAAARGSYLLFIDSDALVEQCVLRRGLDVVQQEKAYFPILYSYTDPQHQAGYWRVAGFGHCMLTREAFLKTNGWPEYNSWGKEDDDFLTRVAEHTSIVRERACGLFHQWHPDDIDFKNRYGVENAGIRSIRARAEQAKLELRVTERLRLTLRSGASYILVDEDRTNIKDGLENQPIPFLERGGQYWGPPANDAQAMRELERLRCGGAEFIVFPWLASWWLEHYSAFAKHLADTAICLANDEVMAVYELKRIPNASTPAFSK